MLNIILIKYKNILFYVLKQTNALFRLYYNFVRIYINDIIIFLYIFENYVNYFN